MIDSPFAVRGVVEGFYGHFYTTPQRNDLIRFLGAQGFNLYVYGPKDDPWHRESWRKPYPPRAMACFQETVAVAQEAGVNFCFALSPGLSLRYASQEDRAAIQAKWCDFYELGVRAFSLFLDDIPPGFWHDGDRQFASYAAAHADLCNDLYGWLQALDPACTLSMCPTYYAGVAPFQPYVTELGEALHPAVDVFYTGNDVCTPAIRYGDVAAFAAAIRRKPLIWDNYPVNDLGMRRELHLGPLRGRDARLPDVTRGMVANPMLQPEASRVPLATYGAYLADPACYEPEAAWERALAAAAGAVNAGALRQVAAYLLRSCLGPPPEPPLAGLARAALDALAAGERPAESAAVAELLVYLQELQEVAYQLRYFPENLALREKLLPWLEALDASLGLGQNALRALIAYDCGEPHGWYAHQLQEMAREVEKNVKWVNMESLQPLAAYARQQFA